jgi:hypothetical protein
MSDRHDVASTLPWMREGTTHLLRTVEKLADDDLNAPSALPGWTRAHVVGHLARNAEALTRLATWARTGVKTPMYPGPDARAAEIEESAKHSPEVLRRELAGTAETLLRTSGTSRSAAPSAEPSPPPRFRGCGSGRSGSTRSISTPAPPSRTSPTVSSTSSWTTCVGCSAARRAVRRSSWSPPTESARGHSDPPSPPRPGSPGAPPTSSPGSPDGLGPTTDRRCRGGSERSCRNKSMTKRIGSE